MSCETQVAFILRALEQAGAAVTFDNKTYTAIDSITLEQTSKDEVLVTFRRGAETVMQMQAVCDFSKGAHLDARLPESRRRTEFHLGLANHSRQA